MSIDIDLSAKIRWIENNKGGELMKRLRKVSIFLIMSILMLGMTVPHVAYAAGKNVKVSNSKSDSKKKAKQSKKRKNGWYKKNLKTYYYKNGYKYIGWHKIENQYYYFNEKGVLQKNTIVGSAEKGYNYVDAGGILVVDSAIKCAVNFVMKYSSPNQSTLQRLKSCYNALCGYSYQRVYSDQPSASVIRSYALYMFNYKKGNCYRYGSALAYIARVLGLDSRVSVGGVTAYAYRNLSPHGWCEINIGGVWRLCDCSMQRAHTSNNLFLVEWNRYPFRIRPRRNLYHAGEQGRGKLEISI